MIQAAAQPVDLGTRIVPVILAVGFAGLALATPSLTLDSHVGGRTHLLSIMTHNQPWNLVLFLGLPALLLTGLAATSMTILLLGDDTPGPVRGIERFAGLALAPTMLGLAVHLARHEVLDHGVDWLGVTDALSMAGYLLLVVPATIVTLAALRVVGQSRQGVRAWHTAGVIGSLVLLVVVLFLALLSP